jgi:hypothetical protein
VLPLGAPPPPIWCGGDHLALAEKQVWARAPSVALCTTPGATVHHQGCLVSLPCFPKARENGGGHRHPCLVAPPNNPEATVLGGLAEVAPPHPVRCHRHPYPVTNGRWISTVGAPSPMSGDHITVSVAPVESAPKG